MKLNVCLFDKNCEEFFVTTIRVRENATTTEMFDKIRHSAAVRDTLRRQRFILGDFNEYSAQVDSRAGVVRFRDRTDTVDEPGNIAMMINLRYKED